MSTIDLSVIPVVKVRVTSEHDLKDRAVTSEHWTTWFFDIIESPAAKNNWHIHARTCLDLKGIKTHPFLEQNKMDKWIQS